MSRVKTVIVPRVLVFYRIHESQLSPSDEAVDVKYRADLTVSGAMLNKMRVGILTICTGRQETYSGRLRLTSAPVAGTAHTCRSTLGL